VSGVVHAVRASLLLTRAIEGVLFFVAGLLATRAAALLSGLSDEALRAAWPLAASCGVLCAASWWLEHRQGTIALARALDERLRHHGALLTAFELEQRAARTPRAMEELVSRRVLERLRRGEALRALVPPFLAPVAAPTLAGLALVCAHDARGPRVHEELDFLALAQGFERALSRPVSVDEPTGLAGEDPGGGLSRAERQELLELLAARAALPFSAPGWREDPAGLGAELLELDRRLVALREAAEPGSELAESLEEARVWLDALQRGVAGGTEPPASAGTEPGGLTGAREEGTISGSPPALQTARSPADPMAARAPMPAEAAQAGGVPAPAPLGLQAGRWWPAEYDSVVARWLELEEAARGR
jgi:hypothetical protein